MKLTATGADVLEHNRLSEHVAIFGATGSGKTGMTITLVEEALLAGVPVLAIDTKGDLTNLALVFDGFDPDDFDPWTDRVSAANAQELADDWRAGIEAEGNLDRHAQLADIPRTIFTPGSSAGVPLNVLSSLAAPSSQNLALEIGCTLNSLFELIDEPTDPGAPGYVVCGKLLEYHWTNNEPVDLERLIVGLIDPPFRKLGVVDLDHFMNAAARRKLAIKLDLLLASSAFQALASGRGFEPAEFFDPAKGPTCSIVSVSHLADDQRQFVVSRLLAEVATWMHSVGGSDEPRLLVVLDETADYCPASGVPPAKDEVLELVKQGRSFGVGLCASANNPYDIDHRLMANCGTWIAGRLRNDRDLDRFAESEIADRGELRETIMGLEQRQFAVMKASEQTLTTIKCRHALSFLAGPLARPQIRDLTERVEVEAQADLFDASARPVFGAPDDDAIGTGDDLPDLPQRWSVGGWVSEYGGSLGAQRRAPMLVVTADLRWDRDVIDLDMVEERHEINFPIGSERWWSERSLGGLAFEAPGEEIPAHVPLDEAAIAAQIERAGERLRAVRTRELAHAPGMRMWARPGESIADFRARCRSQAITAARAEVAELDNHLDRQTFGALDRLAELTESEDADIDELRLHLIGVVAELRKAKLDTSTVADEIEADWLDMSSEIEMGNLTIDPDLDLELIPWILWIPV